MEYTQNYNLKKPGQEDFYNVDDFNSNADIIDQKLKEIEDEIENIEAPVTSVNGKTGDVELTAEDVGAATKQYFNVTLDTSWLGSAAPYEKSVAVTGILETDTPIIDVVMSGTYSQTRRGLKHRVYL